MTVTNETNETSVVGTNTVGQEVPYSFPTASSSDVRVARKLISTGNPITLTEGTNYTITVGDTGGTVTMITAIPATSEIWVIRDTPMTQTLDLETGDAFNAENVEDAIDKNTKLIIENANIKHITSPETDDPSLNLELPTAVDRAEKYLYCDSDGNITVVASETVGSVAFGAFGEIMAATASASAANTALGMSAFMKTLLNDFNATIHLATLGLVVSAYGKTLIDDADASAAQTTLGISTYIKTLIDDATAAEARVTLGAVGVADVVCYEGDVVTYENEIVTWVT